jgi:hypothetical protein
MATQSNLYNTFSAKLAPLLIEMFENSLDLSVLPQTLTEVSITFLLKPSKDASECGSYRPISLLNAGVKILANLHASRIESTDQTGFIKGHHSFSNICRLLNVRGEWEYLFSVLDKCGFGANLIFNNTCYLQMGTGTQSFLVCR